MSKLQQPGGISIEQSTHSAMQWRSIGHKSLPEGGPIEGFHRQLMTVGENSGELSYV